MSILWLPTLALMAQLAPAPVIELHNPTSWDGPVVVEIPLGRIAAPGIVDWTRARLVRGGEEIPFAFRVGRAHWSAGLRKVGAVPRPEDLLVFSCKVDPGSRTSIEVTSAEGKAPDRSDAGVTVTRDGGRLTLGQGDHRIVVDESTGALLAWESGGRSLLSAPFTVTPVALADGGYRLEGPFAVGYTTATIAPVKAEPLPYQVDRLSPALMQAMTEVHVVLKPAEDAQGPDLALTYRLHASGLLEIACDERPWTGRSPWLDAAVEYALPLPGEERHLPYLENRWALYGFHEYTASVTSVATVHAEAAGGVLELGEQSVNGRHYVRRLFPITPERLDRADALAEVADEGLVVDVRPIATRALAGAVRVTDEAGAPAVTEELLRALKAAGVEPAPGEAGDAIAVRLELAADPGGKGISGDGFAVVEEGGGVVLRAGTRLGLYGAVRAVARHLHVHGREGGLPLVARNPVVDLRGGGFGGGNFEVDFPFAEDEEWCRVFDNLLDSGMNVFACMGMWANWKMPVGYRYMPELRSDAPDAYDESSGAKFAELDFHREHGLKLAKYLQDRGGQVWLWIPIGCVPTTYAQKFPEAMAPGSDKIPCFTHPQYQRYIDAFFRELIETYPLDGLFLVRDDNGGICTCDRCKAYVAQSKTQSPVWEQYVVIHQWLRTHGFKGAVAVYPYNDVYEPKLDPLLPPDLYVVGHGAGAAVLARDYRFLGPMGDTWLDNLYANFRVPPSPRMRRLLADRGSFWIGGAYVGCELPWESIGYFGWEPTATPNTLRYEWACRELGPDHGAAYVSMSDDYEALWDINALYMPPADWMKLSPERRAEIVAEGDEHVRRFREGLSRLNGALDPDRHARWTGHMDLFAPYFEYHLHRLDLFAKVYDRVMANRAFLERPEGLPKEVRDTVLREYAEIYEWAARYDAVMQKAPEGMLTHCKWMTKPYNEWMAGYDQWLDAQLELKQFAGEARIEADPLRPGQPFTLRVDLHNRGACPWIAQAGQRLEFGGEAQRLGLPAVWVYEGEPMAPGDRRTVEFRGTAPAEPGAGNVSVAFLAPYRVPEKIATAEAPLSWK